MNLSLPCFRCGPHLHSRPQGVSNGNGNQVPQSCPHAQVGVPPSAGCGSATQSVRPSHRSVVHSPAKRCSQQQSGNLLMRGAPHIHRWAHRRLIRRGTYPLAFRKRRARGRPTGLRGSVMARTTMDEWDVRSARTSYLPLEVRWRGPAPKWSDLGCRGCWGVIQPGEDAVETGKAPFHGECFDIIVSTTNSQD